MKYNSWKGGVLVADEAGLVEKAIQEKAKNRK